VQRIDGGSARERLTVFAMLHYDAGVTATWFSIALGIAAVCATAVIRSEISAAEAQHQPNQAVQVQTPTGGRITAELADTTEKRARGLMFRDALPADRGMLFTFAEAQPWTFWMKNTRIPLDIIWLDRHKRIVHLERNVPGCTRQDDGCPQYQPNEDAVYVLELAAGQSEALGLKRGLTLQFELPAGHHPEPSPGPRRPDSGR
jgi:uncharacterized membrane protein (UPF0127 family)